MPLLALQQMISSSPAVQWQVLVGVVGDSDVDSRARQQQQAGANDVVLAEPLLPNETVTRAVAAGVAVIGAAMTASLW